VILHFRCPDELKTALQAKAADEMTSVSACMRRLLVRSLALEGTVVTRAPDLAESQKAAA
jgi:hypothetical protein